jgi:AraC family transcriptional regulator of adaptative response / DNA-3-methyladenine glycosylase II
VQSGAELRPAELAARAEQWRPWRAYAAQHLWAVDNVKRSARSSLNAGK